MNIKLTHLDDAGQARMVDVGAKPVTMREAVVRGRVRMKPQTLEAALDGDSKKGSVRAAAEFAGVMAAKRTADLIPLCHQIALSSIKVEIAADPAASALVVTARAKTSGQTGVEMEALTAVSIACLTIYDMLKAADRAMVIEGVTLLEKKAAAPPVTIGARPNDIYRMERYFMLNNEKGGRLAFMASLFLLLLSLPAWSAPVTVFAASSLTDSLKSIAGLYKARTGTDIVLSFGASSALAQQIDQGAPAELFFSADGDWMDYLQKAGRLADGTRKDLLGNHLVLIGPPDTKTALVIASHFDLAGALAGGRLAIADPASVPAGKYAHAALTSLGVWDSVSGHLAQAENVRVALTYVARGDAPLGIVYTTDALSEKGVRVIATFPDTSHAPIVYPVALTKGATPAAKAFLAFLGGVESRAEFEKAGFIFLGH